MRFQQRTINLLLISIAVLATGTAFFFGLKKGIGAPSIALPPKRGAGHAELISSFYSNCVPLIIEDERRKLDSGMILQNSSLKKFSVQEFVGDNSKLILRFSDDDCGACVNFVLEKLKEKFKDSIDQYVRIVTDFPSEREFRLKVSSMELDVPIWNAPGGKTDLALEEEDFPFLFVLDVDYSVRQIFIPFKEMPEVTDAYLSYIHQQIVKRPVK